MKRKSDKTKRGTDIHIGGEIRTMHQKPLIFSPSSSLLVRRPNITNLIFYNVCESIGAHFLKHLVNWLFGSDPVS